MTEKNKRYLEAGECRLNIENLPMTLMESTLIS